jgi:hypothetical protein
VPAFRAHIPDLVDVHRGGDLILRFVLVCMLAIAILFSRQRLVTVFMLISSRFQILADHLGYAVRQ